MTQSLTAVRTPTATSRLATTERSSHRYALPVLLAATSLIVLDFFIVNVAMASMQRDLQAGPTAVEWVVAGYGLTFAVLLLAAGRLGDRYGRRLMFTAGIGLFTAASLGCGLAPNAEVLVDARFVQGAGAAMISPSVLALIGVLFAEATERARAIGIYATVMGVAAAGGQLVGGVLLHVDPAGLGWRVVFLINVPIGVAILAAAGRHLPESRAPKAERIDVVGVVLATLALTALVLPLVDGREQGWPWWSFAVLGLSPMLFADFVWWQRRLVRSGRAPLVDPRWFAVPAFRTGVVTQFCFWAGQASFFLVLALYLQLGRGLSALQSGLVFSILAFAYLAGSMRAPRLVARFGRNVIVAGALALAAGHVATVLAVTGGGHIAALAPGLLLEGAGMGLCLAPITGVVMAGVGPQHAGAVSGLLSTMQQIGNAAGVALVGLVFFHYAGSGSPRGFAHGFEASTAILAGLLVAVAASARRLPS
ncbi:MAG TPA: MFS transporter [Mycobacteriales bacterium]|jgi:EmrB/QacA subfamily drug resistance transporter|nr:MFS transporter [Mycobacteriales bacterium]